MWKVNDANSFFSAIQDEKGVSTLNSQVLCKDDQTYWMSRKNNVMFIRDTFYNIIII